MPTLDYLTGFNHRVANSSGIVTDELGAQTAGLPAISTTTVRHVGGASMQIAPSAAAVGWGRRTATASSEWCGVVYVNFATLPVSDVALFNFEINGLRCCGIAFDVATGQTKLFEASNAGTTFLVAGTPGGPVLATGIWYRLETKTVTSANPWAVTGQIAIGDGSASTLSAIAPAVAAETSQQRIILGMDSGTATFSAFFTDLATSATVGDYPIGPIQVNGYSPNANGTHNLDAATSAFFNKEVSAVDSFLTTSETTSYQTIDDVPLDADPDAVQVKAQTAFNAISRIGSNAVVSATNVPPAHAVGDLILVFAYRSGSATAPSVATGYTDLGTSTVSGGSARSVRMAYKIATATSGEGAAFTNSTDTVTVVYRNAQSPVAGDITFTQGTTQAQTYGAKTISDTSHSWAAGFIGVSLTATGNSNTAPSGMTNIASAGTAPSAGAHDTNAIRGSNWSSTNVTGSGAGNWITAVIEIKATSTLTQPTSTWYAEYNFADESVLTSAPLAVRTLVAQALDTATASTWAAKLFDSAQGTNVEDVYNGSISFSGTTFQGKSFTQRPNTGGPWTVAALNAVRLRFGYTAAAAGNPRLEAAMLEAVFAVSATAVVTPPHPTVVLQAVPRASTW